MAGLTEDDVRAFLESHQEVLRRAIEEIRRVVEFFITDWGNTWEFTAEEIENARVKDAPRIFAKATRRELAASSQLLERCYEKDDRMRFPVQDLLGVRVLVRSLNDLAAVKRAVEDLQSGQGELYPLGNPQDFDVEDINANPRGSGYRALHIDGSVKVRVGETDYEVPFEVQIKTLAQHVFGQHTHDEAYVSDETNSDPRYELVRGLQRALAEQLNASDLLLAQLEDVVDAVRDDIARREAGPEVDAASVTNAVREKIGLKLRDREAAELAEQLRSSGITATEDFVMLIDPSGDQAVRFASEFQSERRRPPTWRELVVGLVGGLAEAKLEARLAEDVPPNSLDELDPDADLVPPDETGAAG